MVRLFRFWFVMYRFLCSGQNGSKTCRNGVARCCALHTGRGWVRRLYCAMIEGRVVHFLSRYVRPKFATQCVDFWAPCKIPRNDVQIKTLVVAPYGVFENGRSATTSAALGFKEQLSNYCYASSRSQIKKPSSLCKTTLFSSYSSIHSSSLSLLCRG